MASKMILDGMDVLVESFESESASFKSSELQNNMHNQKHLQNLLCKSMAQLNAYKMKNNITTFLTPQEYYKEKTLIDKIFSFFTFWTNKWWFKPRLCPVGYTGTGTTWAKFSIFFFTF